MKITFTVTKCTETKEKKFVLTLVVNEEVLFFGMKKMVKRTYYVGGMAAPVVVGTKIEEDTDNFYIKEYPTAMITDANGNVTFMNLDSAVKNGIDHEVLNLKWLHVKTAVDKAVA